MSKSSRRRARVRARKQVAQRRAAPVKPRAAPAARKSMQAVAITEEVRPAAPRPAVAAVEAGKPGAADAVHALLWRTGLLNVAAIARRELSAMFVSPVGWIVAAAFTFLVSGFGFIGTVLAGQEATLDGVFGLVAGVLTLVLAPVLTMRLIAEERSHGTLELLLTSPVRDWELVVGKWLGAFAFYLMLLATTAVYVVLFAIYQPDKTNVTIAGFSLQVGALDIGLIGATYLGMVVAGASAIAVGVLASSMTRNPIVAGLVSLAALVVIWYASYLLGLFTTAPLNQFLDYVAGYHRYQSFGLGELALKDAVYFASLAVAALFLTSRILGSRRWR